MDNKFIWVDHKGNEVPKINKEFISQIEELYFRTQSDTGITENGLFIWNLIRSHAGLKNLKVEDLPERQYK